jgi:hypothetical protein
MSKFVLLPIIFFAGIFSIQAQQKQKLNDSLKLGRKYFLETNLHSGLVINNYVFWDSFPSRKPSALVELNFGKQTIGEKQWQQHYGFPQVGISLIGGYLGNNNELGFTVGLVPNVTINAINENKWSLKIKMGLGFAYFNKPYDAESNRANILIGSHITNLSIAQFYFRRILNESTDLNFGLSAIHASDGHYQLPNVGLNMITANLGVKHYFGQRPKVFYTDDSYLNRGREIKYGIRAGIGVHEFGNELGPLNQSKYTITDLAIYLKKPAGRLGSALAGLGYKYYSSFYEKIVEDSTFSSNLRLKASVFYHFSGL